MKNKTSELTGALLDAAVAKADGRLVTQDEPGWSKGEYKSLRKEYGGVHVVRWYGQSGDLGGWEPITNKPSPSEDWRAGGPIIERERITVQASRAGDWRAWVGDGDSIPAPQGRGDTPLIAAMRAYVAHKLGDEVEL